jgi:hypothetical protein
LKTPEEAAAYIKQNIADGADYTKLMHESGVGMGQTFIKPSLSLQTALVKASHASGLKVVAHSLALSDTLEILSCGVDGMTHTFCDAPPTDELVEAYKKNNAWVSPTLAIIGSLTTEGKEVAERFAHDERVEKLLDAGAAERMCTCARMCEGKGRVEYAYESVRMLKKAGIDVIV